MMDLLKREREDRGIEEMAALIAQNGGQWPAWARAAETDPDFIVFPCGEGFTALYREEEWYEFNGEARGKGLCPELAIADLVRRFPKEA